ncbi:hypothetical protein [Halodesulfovibrio sp. MK-HDV]|jgi:hypothetical protein|uniref:hypothetical protein n=1 Tax=Halodesulfovibrio sp. MK-HDV TaxID=2599925 RepID=UPI00136934DE|nr:hypothetical protein [Halodesulfovibrio sp. MK-HDV]KAF1075169.1 hypothetical protein MKHDV_02212 [Halodesulfovibrio sp. MK-HDV]
MSLINSLLSKPVEMTQLQKTAQAMQKKSASGVSNLFVNQQTDHSRYIRATIESSRAVHEAFDNRKATVMSVLQMQMDYEASHQVGDLDLSYSRRTRVAKRATLLYDLEQTKKVHSDNDSTTEKERTKARAAEASEAVETVLADATRSVPVPSAPERGRCAVKVQKAPAKISIRV